MRKKASVADKWREKILTAQIAQEANSFIPYGISTQSLMLDLAIGCPGIPGTRLTQVYGLDGTGKSTLMCHLMAEAQAMGGEAFLFDTENCYDFSRAKKIGVDLKELKLGEPYSIEELIEMIMDYSTEYASNHNTNEHPLLFVVDSADGLPTMKAAEKEAEESKQPGQAAKVWNENLPRLLQTACAQNRATLVVVCQQYEKIGERTFPGAPKPLAIKGGVGFKYRASLRFEIKARTGKQSLQEDDQHHVTGYKNSFRTVKNKSSAPYQEADYILTFDSGIDKAEDLFEAGKKLGMVVKSNGYKLITKKKTFNFGDTDGWIELLDKYGADKIRRLMTRHAIREGFLKPYGLTTED